MSRAAFQTFLIRNLINASQPLLFLAILFNSNPPLNHNTTAQCTYNTINNPKTPPEPPEEKNSQKMPDRRLLIFQESLLQQQPLSPQNPLSPTNNPNTNTAFKSSTLQTHRFQNQEYTYTPVNKLGLPVSGPGSLPAGLRLEGGSGLLGLPLRVIVAFTEIFNGVKYKGWFVSLPHSLHFFLWGVDEGLYGVMLIFSSPSSRAVIAAGPYDDPTLGGGMGKFYAVVLEKLDGGGSGSGTGNEGLGAGSMSMIAG